MKTVGKQIPNHTAQQRRRPASSIRQNVYKYDNLRTPCHFQWVVRQISCYTTLVFALPPSLPPSLSLSLSLSLALCTQEVRSIAGIIVALRAFKWTFRRTLDIPPPLTPRGCLSNTHVSRGKVSSGYSTTLADKVIIKKKITNFLSSFSRERSFPPCQWYSCPILPIPENTPLTFWLLPVFPDNSEVTYNATRVTWRRWTQEVVGRDGAARHNELDPHEEGCNAHGGDNGGASAAGAALPAAGRTGDRAGGREGAATGQSGRDKGCAGGREDEVPELTERPEVQVRELLHCSICLFLGLL